MIDNPRPARPVAVGQSWAFTDHRSLAELSPATAEAISACVIVADKIVFDRAMPKSLRHLAARVLARWGQPILPPSDTEF